MTSRNRTSIFTKKLTAVILAVMLMTTYATAAQAETILSIGSTGSDVVKVEERLIKWGYLSGKADGVYDQSTMEAVKKFQKRNGLTADGRVGKATAAAIGITLTSGGSSSSSSKTASAKYISSDHKLLARVVYAEARGESYKGQVAVAAVVLNRVRSASFPNTVYSVVYQKNAFTCVNDGQINLTPNDTAIKAARDALNGVDPTGGCLYYYNPVTAIDSWIRTRTIKMQIGRHVFAV